MNPSYTVQVEDTPSSFKFRLVNSQGKSSPWRAYSQIARLDNMLAATEYELPQSVALTPLTMQQFVDNAASFNQGA